MDYPDENTIRILITTDNHVGYNENEPITGNDSWKTFQEIMMIAKNNKVDMIIQGGDLFHVNNPTKKSLYQVMKSLRLACMGDKPCELELLSDPSKVFHYNEFTNVNYEDPNFNISIPMFAIAGNHDDATGDSFLCPMDILQVGGLVNHFGKVMETDNIKVVPLLFQKGDTKLALYGMASVRDERLFRTFKDGNVTFEVPAMREGEWFNIMCVHQNHTGHSNTAFLPEQFLPDFLDIVIWGHEHECVPHLVHNPTKNFDVLQAGSSVATSLCEAEAQPKNVFILELKYNLQPKLIPVPLNSVRTFVMRSVALRDVPHLRPHDKEGITRHLVEQVEEMISEANEQTKEKIADEYSNVNDNDIDPQIPLPLIRLRVDYSGPLHDLASIDYQVENPRRVSNKFVGRVANSNNVIQFFKSKKRHLTTTKRNKRTASSDKDIETLIDEAGGELEVQTLVNDLLAKMQLSLLPEVGMNEAVKKFVEKDEKLALKDFIDREIDNEVDILFSNKDFLQTNNPEHIKSLIKQVKRSNNSVPFTPQQTAAAEDLLSANIDAESSNSEEHESNEDIVLSHEDGLGKKPARGNTESTRKKKPQPETSSIILLEEADEANNIDERVFSEEDEDMTARRNTQNKTKASRAISTSSTKRISGSKAKSSRTPKTDILSSLLARKRR
ncbi:hypothetical protein HG535_0B01950 [Zygotorulaspora mrakii]|uniref:Double-strand break repair protein n=1 Tax=Zygotorulaspora mrakii TaxID=42260 RepID=A0A7H9AYA3_ZYGMR|nr:uncharacterized protein HG535_0B01950 [Zygotorulaspora mrakii]QLG71157.1 hypothetical protein HG535_0B01950 [Zygotorulaspora mrakii]